MQLSLNKVYQKKIEAYKQKDSYLNLHKYNPPQMNMDSTSELTCKKKKVSRVQMLIKQSKKTFNQTFREPKFMMLACFTQMTELEKSQLTPQFRTHLQQKKSLLPMKKQQIQKRLSENTEEDNCFDNFPKWTKPALRQGERQLCNEKNIFIKNGHEVKKLRKSIARTSNSINY